MVIVRFECVVKMFKLNVKASEFVPNVKPSDLNVKASEFVPEYEPIAETIMQRCINDWCVSNPDFFDDNYFEEVDEGMILKSTKRKYNKVIQELGACTPKSQKQK